MGFNKLPGNDVLFCLRVIPELKEMLQKGDYQILGAGICDEHEVGVILVASRNARTRHDDNSTEVAKCFVDSALSVIKSTFGTSTVRVRKAGDSDDT